MRDLRSTVPDLDDARWDQIVDLIPRLRHSRTQVPPEPRTIVAGILWVARTGRSWQDLPPHFGPWKTIHGYYHRWKQKGYWQPILAALRSPLDEPSP